MTTMHITHSHAEAPEMAATSGPSARRAEAPAISELVLATLHLEHLAETAGPPDDETTAHMNGSTPEQQRAFVLGTAYRIRAALDKITAPFEAPAPTAPPDAGPAGDGSQDPPPGCAPSDVALPLEAAAMHAVLTGDRHGARRIVAVMLPDERTALAGHLDELRKLLGPVCDNCGNLAEIGTSTTDPFSEVCRFLCDRCTAARRIN